jgi:hypothetical protein
MTKTVVNAIMNLTDTFKQFSVMYYIWPFTLIIVLFLHPHHSFSSPSSFPLTNQNLRLCVNSPQVLSVGDPAEGDSLSFCAPHRSSMDLDEQKGQKTLREWHDGVFSFPEVRTVFHLFGFEK